MNELLKKYKQMMAVSLAAMRINTNDWFTAKRPKSKLAEAFGLVGWGNPRFHLTTRDIVVPIVRSAAAKARKLAMRRAKRVRIDTRGYA